MTRDDVIRMARESGFEVDDDNVWITDGYWLIELTRFYDAAFKAGVEAEREACAKVCELIAREIDDTNGLATYCAKAIRARGEK